jgi:RNA polymerase sigma factor (sigma-70 family)
MPPTSPSKPLEPPCESVTAKFAEYQRELSRFLLRRVPQTQDAGDLVQEVFVRVLSVDRATLIRNPRAYLYGIAAHVAREFRSRSLRERIQFNSQTVEAFAERPADSCEDELTEGIGLEQQIGAVLAQLSPTHLKILVADRRDGLSTQQIADKFGLSVHTVRKYLVQALTRVRAGWHQE